MMKRIILFLTGTLLCISTAAQSQSFSTGKWMELQLSILRELNRSYVDTLPVDRMQRAAIDAMLQTLDPYTVYVPEEENEDLEMMVSKSYGGIGAVIFKPDREGPVIINEPYENSPAHRFGLQCGDEILAIDGCSTSGLDSKESSDRMKGQPGTSVVFRVRKVRSGEEMDITVVRERIHIPDVEIATMITPGVGYISQTGFTEGVSSEIKEAFLDLKRQGMDTLVLDLRGNGGGLLQEAVRIVSMFVPKGSLVVSARGKAAQSNYEYRTTGNPVDLEIPIIVMVDSGSASASEIVSGALQDMDRATVIGRRTFGKGLVQSIRPLPYGGQLKVTTAKYYTPSGRCVQAIDYSHRNEDGSVGHIPDSLCHEFLTAHGRTVKDGGGITPDVDIPYKEYDDIVYSLVMQGLVEQYALEFVRHHESIPPVEEFHFTDYDSFREFVSPKLKSERERRELEALDRSQIIPFIEEEIAVRYYFQEAGARIRIRYDEQLEKAIHSPLIKI